MISIRINAAEVIDIEALDERRAGVWFLNWKIKPKPLALRLQSGNESYRGAGVYAIAFDEQLIYIGSYLGSGGHGADFSGDVVKDRWWAHVGAITARGSKVHIAKRSLTSLKQELGVSHVMVDGFVQATNPQLLHKDAGDLAPLRRLRFAAQRSQEFFSNRVNCMDILKRFHFVYVRLDEFEKNENLSSLKDRIESAEIRLIERLAPICNTKHVTLDMEPVRTHADEIVLLIQKSLSVL